MSKTVHIYHDRPWDGTPRKLLGTLCEKHDCPENRALSAIPDDSSMSELEVTLTDWCDECREIKNKWRGTR